MLRQYKEFKHEVSCLDFASNNRFFVASANETSWKYFDIQEGGSSVFTCQAAHSDHIKVVRFVADDLVLSASVDKSVKLWRVGEDGAELVSQLKLQEAIEDICDGPDGHLIIANGNMLSVIKVDEADQLKLVSTVHVFQKPIMNVHYDENRKRVIAGGLDQQLKFFSLSDDCTVMRLEYRLKVPAAIMSFGMSPDGKHYTIGLVDGTLIMRSKQLEEFEEEQDDEMKMILQAFDPSKNIKSTAKNYKYFYRGQYNVTPDTSDVISGMQGKKQRL